MQDLSTVPPISKGSPSRLRWARRFGSFVGLLVFAWVVAWSAARLLMVSAPLDRADAIVVLSGSATFDERAAWAATLYNEGRAPKIILTSDNAQGGWSTTLQRNPFYWERSVNELRRLGVPREKIEVLPQPVSSTYDEGVLLRQHSEACGFRSILVVTSPYHSRRALWTLRRVFNNSGVAIGMAAVPPGRQSPWPTTWWGHIVGWEMVPGEYLKMLYYHLRY